VESLNAYHAAGFVVTEDLQSSNWRLAIDISGEGFAQVDFD
jgi:hypothetical protein